MILDNEYYMDQQRYTQANQFNVTKNKKKWDISTRNFRGQMVFRIVIFTPFIMFLVSTHWINFS